MGTFTEFLIAFSISVLLVIFGGVALALIFAGFDIAWSRIDVSEDEDKGGMDVIMILLITVMIYYWGGWTAYGANFIRRFVNRPDVEYAWVYWMVGLTLVKLPLGAMAGVLIRQEKETMTEGWAIAVWDGVLVAASVAFLVFLIRPGWADWLYGWFFDGLIYQIFIKTH